VRDVLPIDPFIPRLVTDLGRSRALVVTARPGAGKTTRIPPALLDVGPLILLQPRRVAARAIARRIADERGWTIGREIAGRSVRAPPPQRRAFLSRRGVLSARLQIICSRRF
jgi:ATP-dependent helicase HrpB